MSSNLLKLLNKLIEFNEISNNLSSIQEKFNKSVKKELNLNSINNSVIDEIKVCRSDLKIIEFNQKSHKLKCFWPKCHYKSKVKRNLETHKLIHKNAKQFKCNECNKKFNQSSGLKKHNSLIHSNERKYKCNECNKRFNRKYYLKSHRLIHSNERQFVCDWSQCGQRFKTNSNLNRHKRIVHLKERPFECNECQKKFFYKTDLEIHKRIHSGENPLICEHKNCGKRFNQKSNLDRHVKCLKNQFN